MSTELREVAVAPSYWRLVADKLQRAPELLQVARDNIVRWRAQGQTAPHRLEQWERLLIDAQSNEKGLRHLMNVLLGTEEENERLREFNPFPGILTREERRQARELCGYRH
jgi:hypothetical protein